MSIKINFEKYCLLYIEINSKKAVKRQLLNLVLFPIGECSGRYPKNLVIELSRGGSSELIANSGCARYADWSQVTPQSYYVSLR